MHCNSTTGTADTPIGQYSFPQGYNPFKKRNRQLNVPSNYYSFKVSLPSVKDVYRKEQFTGFFPPPETAKKAEKKPDEPLKAQYPLRPDGFIPNSILARLLWPPEQKVAIDKAYRPPMMSEKQMEQIKKMQKKTNLSQREGTRTSDMLESRTLVLDYGDTETSLRLPEKEEEDDTEPIVHIRGTGKKLEKSPSKDPSSYLLKLQSTFEKPATPTVSNLSPLKIASMKRCKTFS